MAEETAHLRAQSMAADKCPGHLGVGTRKSVGDQQISGIGSNSAHGSLDERGIGGGMGVREVDCGVAKKCLCGSVQFRRQFVP